MPQDAKDLCKKWDHPWRSAILDGLLVYDDPNLRDDEGNQTFGSGNVC